jgi:hypothetical protein
MYNDPIDSKTYFYQAFQGYSILKLNFSKTIQFSDLPIWSHDVIFPKKK